MSSVSQPSGMPSITVRPSPEEKRLFAALAAKRGISESTLALIAIRSLIRDNFPNGLAFDDPAPVSDPAPTASPFGCVQATSVQSRNGRRRDECDRRSTWRCSCAAVISNPPLATVELDALKQAVFVLARYGTVWGRAIQGLPRETGDVPICCDF